MKKRPIHSYIMFALWGILAVESWEYTYLPQYAYIQPILKLYFVAGCAIFPALAIHSLVDGIIRQIKKGLE